MGLRRAGELMAQFQARVALRMMVHSQKREAEGAVSGMGAGDGSSSGVESSQTSNTREYYTDGTAKYLDCAAGYPKLHVTKWHRTTYSHPDGYLSYWRSPRSSAGGGNISVLILILYYSRVRCQHCRKLGEGCMGPPCTFLHTFL